MRSGLARIKQHHEDNKKHHVARQCAEHKGSYLVELLARTAPRTMPVIVAASAPSTRRTAIDRRFSSGTGRFSVDFSGKWGKDRRHFDLASPLGKGPLIKRYSYFPLDASGIGRCLFEAGACAIRV